MQSCFVQHAIISAELCFKSLMKFAAWFDYTLEYSAGFILSDEDLYADWITTLD